MSAEPLVRDFADGTYSFGLDIGAILELEEKCDAGMVTILGRLRSGAWRYNDVRETIRIALIAGGRIAQDKEMTPSKALGIVKRYVDDFPSLDNVIVAQEILVWRLAGAPKPDGDAKKKPDEQTPETAAADTPTEG